MITGFYNRLNLHVHTSDLQVIRATYAKIAPHHRLDQSAKVKASRKQFARKVLHTHRKARALFVHYRF